MAKKRRKKRSMGSMFFIGFIQKSINEPKSDEMPNLPHDIDQGLS